MLGRNARIDKQIANAGELQIGQATRNYCANSYLGTRDSLAFEMASVEVAGTSNREADETGTTTARRIHVLQQHPLCQ